MHTYYKLYADAYTLVTWAVLEILMTGFQTICITIEHSTSLTEQSNIKATQLA